MTSKRDLPIRTPCHVDWRTMTPADGGRFCGDCKKVVRDLSSMTEREARTLLREAKNSELCIRYLVDRQGNVFFAADKAPALVHASSLLRSKRAVFAAAAIAVPLALQACAPEPEAESWTGLYADPYGAYEDLDGASDSGDASSQNDAGDGSDGRTDADAGTDADVDAAPDDAECSGPEGERS